MGKRYKGKLCVYCSRKVSESDDHIFAREFFLVEDRHNLPKAPACRQCNKDKSVLEHYLISALSFGGQHSQAIENLKANATRRLSKNRKLHERLLRGSQAVWVKDGGGVYQRMMAAPFEGEKLDALLKYIARGLVWHHFQKYVGLDWSIRVIFAPNTLSTYYATQFSTLPSEMIKKADLGRGTVKYEVAQIGPPELFICKVFLYGGVMLAHAQSVHAGIEGEPSRLWWVIVGEPELADQVMGRV